MTFTIKHTRSDRPIVAEYLCPIHGRFALEVRRDMEGNAPNEAKCPTWVEHEHHCEDPPCLDCGVTGWTCEELSPFAISAPLGRVKNFEVVRGKWEKPERKTFFDTRKLGEGQPLEEFRAERAKMWDEQRYRETKEMLK